MYIQIVILGCIFVNFSFSLFLSLFLSFIFSLTSTTPNQILWCFLRGFINLLYLVEFVRMSYVSDARTFNENENFVEPAHTHTHSPHSSHPHTLTQFMSNPFHRCHSSRIILFYFFSTLIVCVLYFIRITS